MKRWPIGLALIGTLLAVGIGVCADREDARERAVEWTRVDAPAPATTPAPTPAQSLEAANAIEAPLEPSAPSRNSVGSADANAALVFDVVGSDGAPVSNVRVVLTRAEKLLENRFEASGGRVSFRPLGRDIEVFVLTQHVMRLRTHLEDAVGHHVLQLPPGVTLRGTVLVDDAPPGKRLRIAAESRDENAGLVPPPAFVQRQIDFRGYEGRPSLAVECAPDGRFELRDLPAAWIGTLYGPSEYLSENDGPLEITDVSREVVLRLRERAAITGRVVMPNSTGGASNAYGLWNAECSDGEASDELRSDASGRFRVPMPCGNLKQFTATIAIAGIGRAAIERHDIPATGLDVGDVVLEPARDIEFVVRDSKGRPIEGAITATLDALPIESAPTDADGKGTLPAVPESTDLVRVRALGYRETMRGLESGSTSGRAAIDVVLEPLPQLEIVVEQRNRQPALGVFVRLTCRGEPPFVDESGRPSARNRPPFLREDSDGSAPIQVELGAPKPFRRVTRRGDSFKDWEFQLRYAVDRDGRLRIPGLSPDASLTAQVEDVTGAVLAKSEIAPAFLQSDAPFRIVIDGPPCTLELLVLDAERKPLRGAKVSAKTDGENVAITLDDGIAQVTPIYAKSVDLRVDLAGFFPLRLDGIAVTHTFERREVVMTIGLTVHTRVVDASGAAVAAEGVEAKLNTRKVGKVSRCVIDDECFRIDDLPEQTVQLSAFVEGVRLSKEHDPREQVAVIEIPAHGSVLLEFSEPLVPPSRFVVALTREPDANGTPSSSAEVVRTVPRDAPTMSLEMPVVFPGRFTAEVTEMNPAEGEGPRRCRVEGVVVSARERTVVRAVLSRAN